jgi:hypothetical protein
MNLEFKSLFPESVRLRSKTKSIRSLQLRTNPKSFPQLVSIAHQHLLDGKMLIFASQTLSTNFTTNSDLLMQSIPLKYPMFTFCKSLSQKAFEYEP